MFDEYSIERHIEQIVDDRSRSYFREVYSCYVSGCYRSATVMLWTVAVCDIVFKLRSLIEEYDDKVAAEILDDVESRQMKNPRGSDWELELVKQTTSRTQLLTLPEKMHLEQLQEERHLAAHPVLTNFEKLHAPTRETTVAHMRNVLDSLLTKPALLSKDIVRDFVEDIAKRDKFFSNFEAFETFLVSRYFLRMNNVVMLQLFKALWKFVFRAPDTDCQKNLQINYHALVALFHRKPQLFLDQIRTSPSGFGAFALEKEEPTNLLIRFLAKFPAVYHALDDAGREEIIGATRTSQDSATVAWFLAASPEQHLARIRQEIEKGELTIGASAWETLEELDVSDDWIATIHELAVLYYTRSTSYADADQRFCAIAPLLPNFAVCSLKSLVKQSCENRQTYDRNKAHHEHLQVVELIPEGERIALAAEFPRFGPWPP